MTTNKKQLRLMGRESVKVTNIQGTTQVTVETTGKAVVERNPTPVPYVQPYHTVAATDVARLMESAHGFYKKVEVRLPADMASPAVFLREVVNLLDIYLINRI